MALSRVFCIGNGESRKGFDLEQLKQHGKIYGCNAIYRDFTPDVLISVDQGIMHEIYHSGYCHENESWFRDWTKVPAMHYEMMVYAGLTKLEVDELKETYDSHMENERINQQEFVMHGANLSGIANIIKKNKSKGNKVVKEHVNHSHLYVSWISDEDKSHSIIDIFDDNVDRGWAAGPTSGYIACKKEKPCEVFLIGHDLRSNNNTVNNLFKGTKHYVTESHKPTPYQNWVIQWDRLFKEFPDIHFYKVNKKGELGNDNVSCRINDWNDNKNLFYIDYQTMLDKCN